MRFPARFSCTRDVWINSLRLLRRLDSIQTKDEHAIGALRSIGVLTTQPQLEDATNSHESKIKDEKASRGLPVVMNLTACDWPSDRRNESPSNNPSVRRTLRKNK